MDCRSVAVVGTAKNTGKTTTLVSLVEYARGQGAVLGLTSVGYDGEDLDNLTGLPKPRIWVPGGTWVATASACISVSPARLVDCRSTGVQTPLGEVYLGRAAEGGRVVLAGPNNRLHLAAVLEMFGDEVRTVLVDGAFSRLAPAAATDGIVLATGAARHRRLDVLAEETRAIVEIFSLPSVGEERCQAAQDVEVGVALVGKGTFKQLVAGPVITLEKVNQMVQAFATAGAGHLVCIRGPITHGCLEAIVNRAGDLLEGTVIAFRDPIDLLVSAEPLAMKGALAALAQKGAAVGLAQGKELLGITVNPFYPDLRRVDGRYVAAYIDAGELLKRIRQITNLPVVDVRQPDDGHFSALLGRCGLEG